MAHDTYVSNEKLHPLGGLEDTREEWAIITFYNSINNESGLGLEISGGKMNHWPKI